MSFAVHNVSSFSIIKLANIQDISQINSSEIYTLYDVIGGGINTLGFVFINLKFKAFNILHKFHVVPDDFGGDGMPENGTLAREFLRKHASSLSFDYDKGNAIGMLTLRHENARFSVKILEKKRVSDGTALILSYHIGNQH